MRPSTAEGCCSKMASRQTDVSLDVEEQKQHEEKLQAAGTQKQKLEGACGINPAGPRKMSRWLTPTYTDGAEEQK